MVLQQRTLEIAKENHRIYIYLYGRLHGFIIVVIN